MTDAKAIRVAKESSEALVRAESQLASLSAERDQLQRAVTQGAREQRRLEKALNERDAKLAALSRVQEGLRKALDEIQKLQPEAIDVLRQHGYVFERFPRDMRKEPPVGDGERWEAMAFSLYTRIAQAASTARAALDDADAARSPAPGSQGEQGER